MYVKKKTLVTFKIEQVNHFFEQKFKLNNKET